jgi:hypothetical protein
LTSTTRSAFAPCAGRAGLRNETVSLAVADLAARGLIESTRLGYCLVNHAVS